MLSRISRAESGAIVTSGSACCRVLLLVSNWQDSMLIIKRNKNLIEWFFSTILLNISFIVIKDFKDKAFQRIKIKRPGYYHGD